MNETKKALLRQHLAALSSIGAPKSAFVCVMCGEQLSLREAIGEKVSIEDVPPKSVGGKPLLLTCRLCNNSAGTEFEKDLSLRHRVEEQARRIVGQVDGAMGHLVVTAGGNSVNVDAHRHGKQVRFSVSEKNNPATIEAFAEVMNEGAAGLKVQVSSSKTYHPKRAKLADQKSAFLIFSAKFGYTYALNARNLEIRRQLVEIEESPPEPIAQYMSLKESCDNVIAINEEIGLATVTIGKRVIGLPWPSHPLEGYLERWQRAFGACSQFKTLPLPRSFEAQLDFLP
ncbi:MAG: hypothetical protein AAFU80_11820 [Pseudomonadota bacterium]